MERILASSELIESVKSRMLPITPNAFISSPGMHDLIYERFYNELNEAFRSLKSGKNSKTISLLQNLGNSLINFYKLQRYPATKNNPT